MPVNPNVYQASDGHPYKESPWPSLKGRCELCGSPLFAHKTVEKKS